MSDSPTPGVQPHSLVPLRLTWRLPPGDLPHGIDTPTVTHEPSQTQPIEHPIAPLLHTLLTANESLTSPHILVGSRRTIRLVAASYVGPCSINKLKQDFEYSINSTDNRVRLTLWLQRSMTPDSTDRIIWNFKRSLMACLQEHRI